MSKIVFESIVVAIELLEASQKPKTPKDNERIVKAALSLTKTDFPHDHQFDAKSANDMGLTISKDDGKLELLKTYKEWVSCKLHVKETNHIVETYIPKEEVNADEKSEKTTSEPKSEKTGK